MTGSRTSPECDELFRQLMTCDQQCFTELCARVAASLPCDAPKPPVRNIGLFTHSLHGGGIQRVVAMLSSMFVDQGYRITLFLSSPPTKNDYELPANITRVLLPAERPLRSEITRRAIQQHKIDTCIHNDHYKPETYYDVLCTRILGCRTIAIQHSMYFSPFYAGHVHLFALRRNAYPLLDALVCLSRVDLAWWCSLGLSQTLWIPNPSDIRIGTTPKAAGGKKNVLLMGRLNTMKGMRHIPELITTLLERDPGIRFTILGSFSHKSDESWFINELRTRHATDRVHMPGFVQNISDYLIDSAVLAMVSHLEGHPVARIEANAHGVPAVYFSMPYIEPQGEESGSIMVGKKDVAGMSEAILRLVNDSDYWSVMSERALSSTMLFSNEMILGKWMDLFRTMEESGGALPLRSDAVDSDILAVTMSELQSAVEYYDTIIQEELNQYRYLKPVDKCIRMVFPPGSKHRRMLSNAINAVRECVRKHQKRRRARRFSRLDSGS